MQKDLGNYRMSYEKSELLISNVPDNPLQLFQTWFYEVDRSDSTDEANAMTISTIGLDGFPRSRVVLLKKYTEEGFIFYTNYNSSKGKAIEVNPKVCLSFFWHHAERQVIIKGEAEKVSSDMSDAYFQSRPKGSQIGALVSNQSQEVTKEELENKLKELEEVYKNKEVPRPSNWGGYLIRPKEIEFWQGRPNRLHDRVMYKLENDYNWKIVRLAP